MARITCYYPHDAEDVITLSKEESYHLVKVLRAQRRDLVTVINGQGGIWKARLEEVSTENAGLRIEEFKKVGERKPFITLVQAIPKGKEMNSLIRRATELGVNKIIPIITERTEVRLDEERGGKKREKWERDAIEACKQSSNPFLPEIAPVVGFEEYIKGEKGGDLKLTASLEGDSRTIRHYFEAISGAKELTWLVGPEGDLTEEEYGNARDVGFEPVVLGQNVMRVETAALAAIAISRGMALKDNPAEEAED